MINAKVTLQMILTSSLGLLLIACSNTTRTVSSSSYVTPAYSTSVVSSDVYSSRGAYYGGSGLVLSVGSYYPYSYANRNYYRNYYYPYYPGYYRSYNRAYVYPRYHYRTKYYHPHSYYRSYKGAPYYRSSKQFPTSTYRHHNRYNRP